MPDDLARYGTVAASGSGTAPAVAPAVADLSRYGTTRVAPQSNNQPADKGFLGQLWEDLSNLPHAAAQAALHPLDSALSGIVEPALQEYRKAKQIVLGADEHATEDPRQRFGQAILHGLAAA